MKTLFHIFKERVTQAIQQAFGDQLGAEEQLADMAPCAQEEFGGFGFPADNVAPLVNFQRQVSPTLYPF